MRAAPVDLTPALPAVKPYFYGSWANTAVSNAWTALPITQVLIQRAGMALSGGGCQVPVKGLYHLGMMFRIDQGVTAQSYFHMSINVNGSTIGYSIINNGSVGGVYFPYAYAQLWLPQPLNAGDVVTSWAYNYAGAATVFGIGSWGGVGLRVLYDSPWTGLP